MGRVVDISGKINKHKIFLGALLFLLIRLINLDSLPIFNDEAIYLHWGKQFFWTLGSGFPMLVTLDGKQAGLPIVYGLLQFLPVDPLITVRLFGVFFSILTYYFSLKIFRYFYPHDSPILLIILLTFCPYLLFFDRMALPENVIITCYTAAFYLVLNLTEKPALKKSILLGFILALGWWFKSTILLFFPSLFFYYFWLFLKDRKKSLELIKYYFVSGLIFIMFISPLLLSSDYQRTPFNETARILSFTEVLSTPVQNALSKANHIFFWFFNLTSPLALIAFVFSFIRNKSIPKKYILTLFVILPIFLEAVFLKIFTSRYIVFVVPLFLILVYEGLRISGKVGRVLGILLSVNFFILGMFLILFPAEYYQIMKKMPIMEEDANQYFVGWTSGWGIKEAVDYIYKDAAGSKAVVFIRFDSGNPEDAAYVYFNKNNISISLTDLLPKYQNQKDLKMYYLSRGTQMAGLEGKVRELRIFPKPYDKEYIGVYRMIN